jgi:hypothetical protein
MPKWDGLKPLPNHVLAPLLRALACIPRTADARLLLRTVDSGRRPGMEGQRLRRDVPRPEGRSESGSLTTPGS